MQENIDYCQDFSTICQAWTYAKLSILTKVGFVYQTVADQTNVTLNLLMGVQVVLYANTVDKASHSQTLLNFWGEAYQNLILATAGLYWQNSSHSLATLLTSMTTYLDDPLYNKCAHDELTPRKWLLPGLLLKTFLLIVAMN